MANAASGIAVADECKLKFQELRAKRNYRFITLKIDEKDQRVTVDKLGEPEQCYEDFSACMPEIPCRYAVFDFDFVTAENCQKSKIIFVACYAPATQLWRGRLHVMGGSKEDSSIHVVVVSLCHSDAHLFTSGDLAWDAKLRISIGMSCAMYNNCSAHVICRNLKKDALDCCIGR